MTCPLCGLDSETLAKTHVLEKVEVRMETHTAIEHLGNLLYMFAELHADDRCKAFEEALAFYNDKRPNARVEPEEGFSIRILRSGPIDRAW